MPFIGIFVSGTYLAIMYKVEVGYVLVDMCKNDGSRWPSSIMVE